MNTVTKRLGAAAIATALLMLAGCTYTYQSFQTVDDRYPAISKGEESEYALEVTTPSEGLRQGTIQFRVDGEEEINQKYYLRTVTSFSGISDFGSSYTYLRRAPEGIYKIYGRHINVPEYVETPFPLTIGKTWVVPDPDGALVYTADSLETIETPAGTFPNCLKVSFKRQDGSDSLSGYSYHSTAVGEVKTVLKSGTTSIVYSITNHKPGKGNGEVVRLGS